MAITLADFNKIWASTSPLTPYSFSESNYKQGWNFIGSTPPARQMWDYLQKYNDEKMQYLATNYLPLSGGTMTGNISNSSNGASSIGKAVDNQSYYFFGGSAWNKGASLYVVGMGGGGFFHLTAHDGTTYKMLEGKPDGTLTWNGANIITSAGGTFTGDLLRKASASHLAYGVQRTDFEKGTLANKFNTMLSLFDKNGTESNNRIMTFDCAVLDNGDVRTSISTYKNASGSSDSFAFFLSYKNDNTRSIYPSNDNVVSLGIAAARWSQVYAGTATINTSDERLKANIESVPDEVLDAWGEVNWYQYQFKDSIAEKGENARIHTGAIAQRIESVFESHNLDANRYGLLCYDEWEAEEDQKDSEGNIVQEAREAGNRYSLRYEEALCMEAAYQRRRADRLEDRIEALEKLLMNRTE